MLVHTHLCDVALGSLKKGPLQTPKHTMMHLIGTPNEGARNFFETPTC